MQLKQSLSQKLWFQVHFKVIFWAKVRHLVTKISVINHTQSARTTMQISFIGTYCLTITLSLLLVISEASAGVLLQGFYWDAPSPGNETWWDKLAHESKSLSESGFTAVWIPPVLKGASGGYSNGYDPFDDYDLGSKDQRSNFGTRWGTREQLMRSVGMMRANGLDVYFDNVLGHRSGDDGQGNFLYKDAFGNLGKGRFPKSHFDFNGYNSFGRQVNYANPYTKDHLIKACDWLINALGVQGMRIDMATNVNPTFLQAYLSQGAMQTQFAVSEYWSENLNELEYYVTNQMQGRVSAFDFPLWGRLKDMTNAGGFYDMRTLISAGLNSRQPSHAVTFVENHDTDRGFPTTNNKHLAYAFILTSEGYPSVFWKDYFQYGLKPILDPLIWIHEKFAHGPLLWRHADEDVLIYERASQPGLIVGLNDNQNEAKGTWVQTDFGSFTTLHDYTGNGPDLRTEADGRVEIKVPKNSYVAYSVKGFHWGHDLKSYSVTQQFAGAKDLDIRPVTQNLQSVGRIYAAKGTEVKWQMFLGPEVLKISSTDVIKVIVAQDLSMPPIFMQTKSSFNNNTMEGHFQVPLTGWYEFKTQLVTETENPIALDFWLNVNYQAPKSLR